MALEVVGSTPIVHPSKDRTRYGLFCCFPASVFCFPNKKQEYSVLLSGDRPLGAGLFFRSGEDAKPCGVHFREKFLRDRIAGAFAENGVHSAVGAKCRSGFVADPFGDF